MEFVLCHFFKAQLTSRRESQSGYGIKDFTQIKIYLDIKISLIQKKQEIKVKKNIKAVPSTMKLSYNPSAFHFIFNIKRLSADFDI